MQDDVDVFVVWPGRERQAVAQPLSYVVERQPILADLGLGCEARQQVDFAPLSQIASSGIAF
jgi:hypothetical protein